MQRVILSKIRTSFSFSRLLEVHHFMNVQCTYNVHTIPQYFYGSAAMLLLRKTPQKALDIFRIVPGVTKN